MELNKDKLTVEDVYCPECGRVPEKLDCSVVNIPIPHYRAPIVEKEAHFTCPSCGVKVRLNVRTEVTK